MTITVAHQIALKQLSAEDVKPNSFWPWHRYQIIKSYVRVE
jgi:hypothetical protein